MNISEQPNAITSTATYKVVPIMASLLLAGFLGLFSETALNMAFTDIMSDFSIPTSKVQWLTTVYLLVLGILVPVSALLNKWFTTRQLFSISVMFSIVGSLIAAVAPDFSILLAARVVQAIGTALLLPLMTNTILIIIPMHKRGTAMGIMGLVILFAPSIGPTLSGVIVQHFTWHFIFWFTLPLLAIALIFGMKYIQNVSKVTKPKIDLLSILLSSLGFGGVVYGFSSAGEGGSWTDTTVVVFIVIGIVALLLFGLRQLRMEQPMINLRVFQFPMFALGLLTAFASMMIILSTALLLPMYLKGSLLVASVTAGLVLLPGGVLNGLMSPFVGRLFDRFGPKWMVTPGFTIVVIVLWFLKDISTQTETTTITMLHIGLMIGISLIMMPGQTNGLNQLPTHYYPDGSAAMNTLQQIAGAIGTALAVSFMSAGESKYLSTVANPLDPAFAPDALAAGVQSAFTFALAIALVGFVASLFIKQSKI